MIGLMAATLVALDRSLAQRRLALDAGAKFGSPTPSLAASSHLEAVDVRPDCELGR